MPGFIPSPARRGARVEWPTLALIALTYLGWGAVTVFAAEHRAVAGGSAAGGDPGAAFLAAARDHPRASDAERRVERGAGLAGAGAAHPVPAFPRPASRAPLRPAADRPARRPGVRTISTPRSGGGWVGRCGWCWRRTTRCSGGCSSGRSSGPGACGGTISRCSGPGTGAVALAWAHHLAGLVPVGLWLWLAGTMPFWQYLLGAWAALGILQDPHLPRASGARAGGGAERDHRGPRAAGDPVSQQQPPRGASCEARGWPGTGCPASTPGGGSGGCGGTAATATGPMPRSSGAISWRGRTRWRIRSGPRRSRGGRCEPMTGGLAALPMYDWPELRPATDRLWAAVRDGLRQRGVAAPEGLTRDVGLMAGWTDPGLVLGQTCGLPFVRELARPGGAGGGGGLRAAGVSAGLVPQRRGGAGGRSARGAGGVPRRAAGGQRDGLAVGLGGDPAPCGAARRGGAVLRRRGGERRARGLGAAGGGRARRTSRRSTR